MTNTPASEQEWPKELKEACETLERCIREYGPGHSNEVAAYMNVGDCEAILNALRPPAGVDDEAVLRQRIDDARPEMQAMIKEDLKPGGLLDQMLRSHHTTVTAAGVDTGGHTDVTTENLTDKMDEELWVDNDGAICGMKNAAQSIIDQFNVTRKV